MKSNLHAVYNDPKLNRFKETTRIQPLFKKKFDAEGQLAATLPPPPRNKSSSTLHIDPLQNRLPPPVRSNEEIYMILQKLKAEKLEVMRDLYTYEERYEKKLSMRARLKEISRLCHELQSMAESAQTQIHTEQQLFEKLLLGLQTFALNRLQRQSRKMKGYEDLESVKSEARWSFQTSKLVSGLRCLILGEMEGEGRDLSLTVQLEETSSSFRMTLPADSLPKKLNQSNFLLKVDKPILSRLYFHSTNSTLRLNFDPVYGKEWLQLIIHLKGSPYIYTCIRVTQSSDHLHLLMREKQVSNSDMTLTVPLEDLGISQTLEELNAQMLEKLTQSVGARLSLMQDEHGESRLEWDVNQWQIEHRLYKPKSSSQLTSISPLPPHILIKQKYQEFSIPIHTEVLVIHSHQLTVSMHFSTIAETYRLIVEEGSWQCTFYEEEYREDFGRAKGLQFHSLQRQPVTLFRSVEFKVLLQRLLNLQGS